MANRLLRRVRVPGTDLDVPYAVCGTMMFGKRADEAESRRIVDAALDLGIDFFDTADMYQHGESERILGRALAGRRERCIVATKVGYGRDEEGNEEGTSRKAIMRAVDRSLADLGMDHVDIYYLHRPDYVAPLEETLDAIDEVIRAGKARHFAISNFGAWQSYEVLRACDEKGRARPACAAEASVLHSGPATAGAATARRRPVMAQMIYNLLVRQIEHEYVRFCKAHGLHLTVYNPLAGGLLTGKYASLDDERAGGRFVRDATPRSGGSYRSRYWSRRFFDGMLGLKEIAQALGMSLTHMALSWVAQGEVADSVLLGPSNAGQLLDCVAAGERTIPPDGMKRIDEFLREFDGTDATYAR